MPFKLRVVPEHCYGIIAFEGQVEGAELIAAGYALLDRPGWEPGFAEVLDGTRADTLAITPKDLRALARQEKETRDRLGDSLQIAITQLEVARVVLRLFRSLTRSVGRESQLFSTREEAAAWMGLPALADPLGNGINKT